MTLKDRLAGATLPSKGARPCPMALLIAQLDPTDGEALQSALDSRLTTRVIHTELQAEGYRIGRDTVSNHRNGWCRCPKDTK